LLATTEFGALFNSTLISGQFPETPEPEVIICHIGRLVIKPSSQGPIEKERAWDEVETA